MAAIDPNVSQSVNELPDHDHYSDMNPYTGLDSSQKSKFAKQNTWIDRLADLFN